VAAILWLVSSVGLNDTRITRIESNRFTATDGQIIQRELLQELALIRERLSAIEARLENSEAR
jgi:hypothetical protein